MTAELDINAVLGLSDVIGNNCSLADAVVVFFQFQYAVARRTFGRKRLLDLPQQRERGNPQSYRYMDPDSKRRVGE